MFSRYPRVMRPLGQWAEVLDLLAAFTCAALIAAIALDRVGPARIMLAVVFIFFAPGRAIVSNWPRMARWSEAAMPMVISLALTCLIATVALWAHLWYPLQIFQAEAWLSLAGLIVGIVRRRRLGLFGSGPGEGAGPAGGFPPG